MRTLVHFYYGLLTCQVRSPEDEPFPHLNNTTTFRRLVRRRSALAYALPAAALLVASALFLLRKRLRR